MGIKQALLDDKIKKVIVIAHSQGAIIISGALDNLLADLARECIPPSSSFSYRIDLGQTFKN
jgi:hypothetical protein